MDGNQCRSSASIDSGSIDTVIEQTSFSSKVHRAPELDDNEIDSVSDITENIVETIHEDELTLTPVSSEHSETSLVDVLVTSTHKTSFKQQKSVSLDYTEDFESDTGITPRKAWQDKSVSFAYSDDFESDAGSPRKNGHTESYSLDYPDDFMTDEGITPRQLKGNDTARSVSADYSDDFDTDTGLTPRSPRKPTTHRSVSFDDYTEDFEVSETPRSVNRQYSIESEQPGYSRRGFTYTESFESTDDSQATQIERATDDDSTLSTIESSTVSVTSALNSEEEEAMSEFVKKKLRALKRPKPSPRRSKAKPLKSVASVESRQQQKFCQARIEAIRKQDGSVSESVPGPKASARMSLRGLAPDMDVCQYGISPTIISKLKMENTMHNIKKAASVKVHEPRKCLKCRDTVALFAAEDFAREKAALVKRKMVEEKMETFNRQCNDPLYLMQEILKDLPSMKAHPDVIYETLMRPLRERNKQQQQGENHAQDGDPHRDDTQGNAGGQQENLTTDNNLTEHDLAMEKEMKLYCEEIDVTQYCEEKHYPDNTRDFWRLYFSRLKSHVGKDYMNFYN